MKFVSGLSLLGSVVMSCATWSAAIAQDASGPAAAESSSVQLEEIVVTGSRLAQTGNTPTPVTLLDTAAVEQRAPAAIAEMLYELPTFRDSGPTQSNRGTTTVGMNVLDLRSLGATRTLVLLNGQRFVPSNTSTSWDTNLVPTGLVERMEIVTGGASAAYGSDAVSGVVNIILKEKLEGLQGSVHYGLSEYGDNKETAFNLAGGFGFAEGRGHVIAGADFSDNHGIGKNIGFYARDWGKNEYGRLAISGARPAGVPANIISDNIQFSNQTPGGIILGSTTTAGAASTLLRGTAFDQNGMPYAFQYGSLVGSDQMYGSPANYGYTVTGRQALRTPLRRMTTLVRASYDLTDDTSVFGEYIFGKSEGHGNTAQATFAPTAPGGQIVLNVDNPYLPAATRAAMVANNLRSVNMGRLLEENMPFNTNNVNETRRVVLGARGALFKDWQWDAYYEDGTNHYNLDVPNIIDIPNFRAALYAVTDSATGQIVCGSTASNPNLTAAVAAKVQPGCVPLNLIGAGAPSAAALDYVSGHMFSYVTSREKSAAFNVRGDVAKLWAGPLSAAAGAEWRRNTSNSTTDARSQIDANWYGNYKPIHGAIEVYEGYVEGLLPLLADQPLAKSLDLNAAVRSTHYSTSGNVTTWKTGLTYEPVEMLRLRATKSRDIRAPNIGELYQAGTGGVFTGSNPATGGSGSATTVASGNPNLKPEIADTFTAGFTLQPSPSLKFSVDYFSIKISDVIATINNNELVSRCFVQNQADVCALFTLNPSVPLGFTSLKTAPLNLNSQKTHGIDFEAGYRFSAGALNIPGDFTIRAFVTWVDQLETFAASGSLGDRAGSNEGNDAGTPKLRGTLNVSYDLGRFSTTAQLRAFTNVKYGVAFVGPEDPGYSPTLSNSINKNRYPGFAYLNWSAQYALSSKADRPVKLFFNIDNVFNRDPPFGWIQDIATYDTIGRTYKAGVRFSL